MSGRVLIEGSRLPGKTHTNTPLWRCAECLQEAGNWHVKYPYALSSFVGLNSWMPFRYSLLSGLLFPLLDILDWLVRVCLWGGTRGEYHTCSSKYLFLHVAPSESDHTALKMGKLLVSWMNLLPCWHYSCRVKHYNVHLMFSSTSA